VPYRTPLLNGQTLPAAALRDVPHVSRPVPDTVPHVFVHVRARTCTKTCGVSDGLVPALLKPLDRMSTDRLEPAIGGGVFRQLGVGVWGDAADDD